MRTADVYKVTIGASRSRKKDVLHVLQCRGIAHIEGEAPSGVLTQGTSLEGVDKISELLVKLNYIIASTGPKLSNKKLLSLLPLTSAQASAESLITRKLGKIEGAILERDKLIEEQLKLQTQQDMITRLPEYCVPKTTGFLRTLLYESTTHQKLELPLQVHQIITKQGKNTYYAFIVSEKDAPKLTAALRAYALKEVDLSFVTADKTTTLKTQGERLAQIAKRLSTLKHEISTLLQGEEQVLFQTRLSLENYHDQFVMGKQVLESKSLCFITCYVLPESFPELKNSLPFAHVVAFRAEQGPTKLRNPVIIRSFEVLTELFGIPRYGAIDPTRILAVFFPFFFGFMLSDIGYGLMLLAGTLAMRAILGKKAHDATIIFTLASLSTILFGWFFGAFFGNLIQITPLFADGFAASFRILIGSLGIGLIHINLGIVLKFLQARSSEPLLKVLKDCLPIPLIQCTAALLYFGMIVPAILTGGLLVLLLLREKGFFGLMDITGFFGVLFSYARLLALTLATGGVALAINIIADKIQGLGILGIVLAAIVLIGGHMFNFAMNLLGSTIHATRLHYVEFFSFFFEGDGTKFTPFALKEELE